jgi:hypothetical protein
LKDGTWNSTCPNRSRRVECHVHDKCDNSRLGQKKFMKLGKDLELRQCWGIDVHTRLNIYTILGHDNEQEEKNHFIDSLIKVSNECGFEGWNIQNSCRRMKEIIENPEMVKLMKVKKEYWVFCDILEKFLQFQGVREGFRCFSKGIGVICRK